MIVEIPGALLVPAHEVNYWRPENHGGVPNIPRALFLHTPEEPADATEVTPHYFARENFNADGSRRLASTHYYASGGQGTLGDGQLYQMVPENCAAIANGLDGKPLPVWALANTSLNWQSLSIEIEGYAATIAQTMPRLSKQWMTVVRWVEHLTGKYNIPLDRAHVMGHYEVSVNRTDPGNLNINAIIADAYALREEGDDMLTETQDKLLTEIAIAAKVAQVEASEARQLAEGIRDTMNARWLELWGKLAAIEKAAGDG